MIPRKDRSWVSKWIWKESIHINSGATHMRKFVLADFGNFITQTIKKIKNLFWLWRLVWKEVGKSYQMALSQKMILELKLNLDALWLLTKEERDSKLTKTHYLETKRANLKQAYKLKLPSTYLLTNFNTQPARNRKTLWLRTSLDHKCCHQSSNHQLELYDLDSLLMVKCLLVPKVWHYKPLSV